jgi:hypothetical protein
MSSSIKSSVKLAAIRYSELSRLDRRWLLSQLPGDAADKLLVAFEELKRLKGNQKIPFDDVVALLEASAKNDQVQTPVDQQEFYTNSELIRVGDIELAPDSLPFLIDSLDSNDAAIIWPSIRAQLQGDLNLIVDSEKQKYLDSLVDSFFSQDIPPKLINHVVNSGLALIESKSMGDDC